MALAPTSLFRILRRTVSAVAIAVLLDAFRKSSSRHHARKSALLPLLLLLTLPAAAQTAPHFTQRVIIISVDGLRSDVIESFDASLLPTFHRLKTEGTWTLNARTDPQFTITMPNHASMMTGRWVHGDDSHGWAYNDDNAADRTIHENNTAYVPSIWDVAHDEGARTGLFATKEKFAMYDRSWNADNGAEDLTSPDYGRDKIDAFVYESQSEDMVSAFLSEASADPFDLTFLHIADPDREGHETGWNPTMGSAYAAAIMHADAQMARVLDFVENDPSWAGITQIIVTADHGGTALNHSDERVPEHFRVPFFVWGSKTEAGADLYALNADRRSNPGSSHIDQAVSEPQRPIQNADAANLALRLLGLPAIPGSPVGRENPLLTRSPVTYEDPAAVTLAFQDGVTPTPDYAGTRDTKLRSDAPSTAFGASDFLEVDAGPDYAALLQWDLSSVPSNATILDASLVLHVTNVSTATYQLYALTSAWDEDSATWIDRASGEPWEVPGGAGSNDRASRVLAEIEGPNLGELQVPLNSAGIDQIQTWINNPSANFGFIVQNFDTADDGLDFSSSEAADSALRPRLELTYVVATTVERPAAPVALFDVANERGDGQGRVTVDASNSMQDGTAVVSWLWDFGDNTTAIGPAAVHSYLNPGTYHVSLTVIDSTGAEDQSSRIVIVDDGEMGDASFQQGVYPLSVYADATDTRVMADNAAVNYGDDVSLLVDGSPFYAALMKWDLTAIAPGVEVTRAALNVHVTNPSTDSYELYPLLSPWSESEATWEQAGLGSPWAMEGAADTSDRLGEPMGTLTAGVDGAAVVELNEIGRVWVAQWINDPATNHGFVIQNYDSAEDGVDFHSSEAEDPALRPRLGISYQIGHHVSLPEATEFDVWPNPFRNDLSVSVLSDIPHPIELEIYDMLGRRVLSQTLDAGSFGGVRLDTSFLAAGVYALVLTEHSTRISSTRLVTRQ